MGRAGRLSSAGRLVETGPVLRLVDAYADTGTDEVFGDRAVSAAAVAQADRVSAHDHVTV